MNTSNTRRANAIRNLAGGLRAMALSWLVAASYVGAQTPEAETQTPAKVDTAALRRGIVDLMDAFGSNYPRGCEYLQQLDGLENQFESPTGNPAEILEAQTESLVALQRQALLVDNPLLDFDQLLLINRAADAPSLGLPRNWQSNSSLPLTGYDDEIAIYSLAAANNDQDNTITTLFRPGDGRFVGVPCVYGNSHVANLYQMDGSGKPIRQLCFDPEHDWCPTAMNDGRVMYTRWEYTDTPHSNTRLLFQMNPDGTEQAEF